jgi:hypothetical protein
VKRDSFTRTSTAVCLRDPAQEAGQHTGSGTSVLKFALDFYFNPHTCSHSRCCFLLPPQHLSSLRCPTTLRPRRHYAPDRRASLWRSAEPRSHRGVSSAAIATRNLKPSRSLAVRGVQLVVVVSLRHALSLLSPSAQTTPEDKEPRSELVLVDPPVRISLHLAPTFYALCETVRQPSASVRRTASWTLLSMQDHHPQRPARQAASSEDTNTYTRNSNMAPSHPRSSPSRQHSEGG